MTPKRKLGAQDSGASAKKRKAITLEQKMDIIKCYVDGQSLSFIARNLDMAVSTVNTIVKEKDRIEEHVKASVFFAFYSEYKEKRGCFIRNGEIVNRMG